MQQQPPQDHAPTTSNDGSSANTINSNTTLSNSSNIGTNRGTSCTTMNNKMNRDVNHVSRDTINQSSSGTLKNGSSSSSSSTNQDGTTSTNNTCLDSLKNSTWPITGAPGVPGAGTGGNVSMLYSLRHDRYTRDEWKDRTFIIKMNSAATMNIFQNNVATL